MAKTTNKKMFVNPVVTKKFQWAPPDEGETFNSETNKLASKIGVPHENIEKGLKEN